jgi:hypothetical protein
MRNPGTKDKHAMVGRDAVVEAIRKALRATQAAQKEAYGDVRTSSTVCTDALDQAVACLEDAAKWMADYQKEALADERRSITTPKAKVEEKEGCHLCGDEIDPGDVAVCGGCDKPTCPNCMGDDGICKECEAEE